MFIVVKLHIPNAGALRTGHVWAETCENQYTDVRQVYIELQ